MQQDPDGHSGSISPAAQLWLKRMRRNLARPVARPAHRGCVSNTMASFGLIIGMLIVWSLIVAP